MSRRKTFCEFKRDAAHEGFVIVSSSYNVTFIDSLKNRVPGDEREWKDEPQHWLIRSRHRGDLVDLAKRCFDTVTEREVLSGETVITDLRTGAKMSQPSLF